MHPLPPTTSGPPSRRRFLASVATASVAATAVAGCRPLFREKAEKAAPDPDVVAAVHALDRERAVLVAYADVVRRHPKLDQKLRAFSKRHEAHCAALTDRLPAGHPARRTPSASPSATPGTKRSAKADLAALADAEQEVAAALAGDALDAGSRLAQVLASMSACAAAHVHLLERVKA